MASKPPGMTTLKRAKATRRQRNDHASSDPYREGETSSPHHERRTFDNQLSTGYSLEDVFTQDGSSDAGTDGNHVDNYDGEKSSRNWCFLFHIQVEWSCSRLFFRIFAVINFLSLIFSGPLFECEPIELPSNASNENVSSECDAVFIQFVILTAVDFILAIVYTLQSLARLEYAVHLRLKKKKFSPTLEPEVKFSSDNTPKKDVSSYVSWYRVLNVILITVSLWYSVAIGVFRSYTIKKHPEEPVIFWAYYPLFFSLRVLSLLTALKLLKYLTRIPKTSGIGQLLDNVKSVLENIWKNTKRWKQLVYVTLFYIIFIYIFALIGIQWIGGLDSKCVHTATGSLSIPVTHCIDTPNDSLERSCFNDPNFMCIDNTINHLNIDERNKVYLGQFRSLADAMFAVYEASTWEKWIFMEYNALSGAHRPLFFIATFYLALFTILVIFVQKSIFLVVIIESFADFRVESSEAILPVTNKPTLVLHERQGQSSENLHLKLIKQESSTAFQLKLNKYYFTGWHGIGIESAFICFVIIDAIVYASKYTGMQKDLGTALYAWQIIVSLVFCLEVVGLLVVHICACQFLLIFKNKYFLGLTVLAVGGLVSSIVYNPNNEYMVQHILVVFQGARLLRVLRLPILKDFFYRVIGNGSRFLMVIITVLIFLCCFAILSMQVFGYLPYEPECERTGGSQFVNFFEAFQSMFQLVMEEGWTDLMGDVMCYRDTWWYFINFSFIILHLFGSLILLNFFVAVILDNLDYDEETKKKKLEEDLKKQKVEKVPLHLKIFKSFGQKKITGPKISSVEVPNLTEADVRNFYNVGESTEFSVNTHVIDQPSFIPEGSAYSRQNSDFSNIELLTEDKSELCVSGVSTMHGRYYGVQSILNYVKAFRQHNRAIEGNRPGQELARGRVGYSGGLGNQLDSSTPLAQSEYDEYREKYHLFDSALFCMPPGHPFRQCCKTLLEFRVAYPKSNPANNSSSVAPANQMYRKVWNYTSYFCRKVWSYIAYYFRFVVSSASLFSWLIILLTLASLAVQMFELSIDPDAGKDQPSYIWISDLVFIVATLTELVLKIFANGLFFNPKAAIRSVWDGLDWIILLATLAVMIAYLITCGASPITEITFNPVRVPIWMQSLLLLRSLRPLRIISLIPSMRRVILDILEGWRNTVLAIIFFCLFLSFYASLGVHLFAGNNSPQEFCNDPRVNASMACVGEFEILVDISPNELIPNDNTTVLILVPRVWYKNRRDFNFDHFFFALVTLFQVLTTEGWLQVRDLFGTGSLSSRSSASWLMTFYIHTFMFFGVNIVLQLFVGIMVNNYNEHKPNHSALLTVSQERWSDLVQRISLTRPIKNPPQPRNRFRRFIYIAFVHYYKLYRPVSITLVVLNSALLSVPWNGGEDYTPALMYASIAFSVIFLIELILKMVAFGPSAFFHSWRNNYDFLVSVFSLSFITVALIHLISGGIIDVKHVADMALFLAIFRLFTIHMKIGVFQNLMTTVSKAIYKSRALLGVLVMFALMYAFVGSLFFSNLRSGEGIDYSLTNFNGILISLNLVIRVVTGEDWYQILWDSMVAEPYCSSLVGNCGNMGVAIVWFISFYMFVSFFLINVVIAVLLESFSIFYEDDDTELNRSVVKDFKNNWYYFDKSASGSISRSRIKLFLRMLKITELHTYQVYENGVKERQKCNVLTDPLLLREMAEELRRDYRQVVTKPVVTTAAAGGTTQQPLLLQELEYSRENHSFQNVLKMLAYRAEDIRKGLVPHELYVREELEESVQFDVAEDCIYKWMQRFVKPVIRRERNRRLTVVHTPKVKKEDSVLWDAPSLNVPESDYSDFQQSAAETEDENDNLMSSLALGSLYSSSYRLLRSQAQNQNKSDDETDVPSESHVPEQNKSLARSYAKLAQLGPPVDVETKDKWHDWFRMQSEWMEKVEADPENYFDDFL